MLKRLASSSKPCVVSWYFNARCFTFLPDQISTGLRVPRTFVEWARGSGYNYEWFSTINLDEFASCQCDWLFCRWYLAENRVILIDLVDFMNSCWLPIVTETNTIQTLSRTRRCLKTDLARHDDSGASRHSFRFIFSTKAKQPSNLWRWGEPLTILSLFCWMPWAIGKPWELYDDEAA